jgi:hypothetical protein
MPFETRFAIPELSTTSEPLLTMSPPMPPFSMLFPSDRREPVPMIVVPLNGLPLIRSGQVYRAVPEFPLPKIPFA